MQKKIESQVEYNLCVDRKCKTELAACIIVHKLSGLSLWRVPHLPKQSEWWFHWPFFSLSLYFLCCVFVTATGVSVSEYKLKSLFDKRHHLNRFFVFRLLLTTFARTHNRISLSIVHEKLCRIEKPWPSHFGMYFWVCEWVS